MKIKLIPQEQIEGGWRVAESDDHWIDILVMAYNHRVVTTNKRIPSTYDHFWCYTSSHDAGGLNARMAVILWAENGSDEPVGWVKNGQTRELKLENG